MNLRKTASILALGAAGLAPLAATADIPYNGAFYTGPNPPYDGLLSPVSGFDIEANGSAAFFCASAGGCAGGTVAFGTQLDPRANNQIAPGDVIRTIYQGVVNVVHTSSAPNIDYITHAGTYQLTVAADFTETVISATILSATAGTASLLVNDGGKVALFYDSNQLGSGLPGTFVDSTAEILAGIGYTDGLLVALGDTRQLLSGITTVTTTGTIASGQATVAGLITSALLGNPAGIGLANQVGFMPIPADYIAGTQLQLGGGITGFRTVNFFDLANGFTPVAVNSTLVERADANIDLSAVPEPATLTLLGISLLGLGMTLRRRVG